MVEFIELQRYPKNAQDLQLFNQKLRRWHVTLQRIPQNDQELENLNQQLLKARIPLQFIPPKILKKNDAGIQSQLIPPKPETAAKHNRVSNHNDATKPSVTAKPEPAAGAIMPTPPDLKSFVSELIATSANPPVSDNPFRLLKATLEDGTYRQEFPIGTEIPDPWTDTVLGKTYQMPWTVVHYGEMRCADDKEHFGAILFRRVAPSFMVEFDATEPDNPNEWRGYAGNNRYALSNLAQWQNSYGEAGKWFIKQREYDALPSIANIKDGYLRGCSIEFLDVLAEQQPVLLDVLALDNDGNRITDRFVGHIFLPSLGNVLPNNASNLDINRAKSWEFFCGTDESLIQERRAVRDASGSVSRWWLCSDYCTIVYGKHAIDERGRLNCYCAGNPICVAPACVFIYI